VSVPKSWNSCGRSTTPRETSNESTEKAHGTGTDADTDGTRDGTDADTDGTCDGTAAATDRSCDGTATGRDGTCDGTATGKDGTCDGTATTPEGPSTTVAGAAPVGPAALFVRASAGRPVCVSGDPAALAPFPCAASLFGRPGVSPGIEPSERGSGTEELTTFWRAEAAR
jgi:hypothetical protein